MYRAEKKKRRRLLLGLTGQGVRQGGLGALGDGGGSPAIGTLTAPRPCKVHRLQRAGQVRVARHLDPGTALKTTRLGGQLLPALPRGLRHNVPSLLRVPGIACGAGHARLAGAAAGGTVFSLVPHPSCQQGYASFPAQSCHNRPGHIFTILVFVGQRGFATLWLRGGCVRRMGEPQVSRLRGRADRRAARADLLRCGRLRCCHGRANHHGPARPKRKALALPRRGHGSQGQGPRDGRGRAGRALHSPISTEKPVRRCVRQEGCTHTLWLLPPWPSKLQDHTSPVPRRREVARLPGTRAKRKQSGGLAAPATGQASDWLQPIAPSRFSQDSQLDPRSFRGHSLNQGGSAQCGAVQLGRGQTRCAGTAGSIPVGALLSNAD